MERYGLVDAEGAILRYQHFAEPPVPDQATLPAGKPRWLPVVEVRSPFDPDSQRLSDPISSVGAAQIVETYVPEPRPLDDRKGAMRRRVNERTNVATAAGYEHDFGAAGVHRLQTREEDRPNWLALAQVATIAISQGGADQVISSIRTEANDTIPVTAQVALDAMLGMQQHIGQIMSHGWGLKDAIEAAGDHAALDAIDVDAGW